MTVSVNPVNKGESDIDQLAKALGVATNVFGVVLDRRRQAKLDEMSATQAQNELARQAEKDTADFHSKFEIVDPDADGAVSRTSLGSLTKKFGIPEGKTIRDRSFGVREFEAQQRGLDRGSREKNAAARLEAEKIKSDREADRRRDTLISGFQDDFKKSKTVQSQLTSFVAADRVEDLLKAGNPISDEVSKTQILRMSGEVGAASDKDIARFSGSQDLKSRAQRLVTKMTTGETLLPQDRADMLAVVKVFKKKAKDAVRREAERYADQKSSFVDLTKDELKDTLGVDRLFPEDAQAGGDGNQGFDAKAIAAQRLLQLQQQNQGTATIPEMGGR